ncbi:DUF6907 domain-containing protein [Streptomyces sp. NPDC008150]|uniref:DUF6907 domain-containing protein n=1 Tax=Streptomyces sp. NPDC008150 TaxID=3364816 RepID=UPI0036E40ADD
MGNASTSVSSATPPPNLRPALVNGQPCWLDCPSWCSEDHVAASVRFIEDVSHSSPAVDLLVPREAGVAQLLLSARLVSDDAGPLLAVEVGDPTDVYGPAVSADVLADRLVAFAEQVRELGLAAGIR